MTVVFLALLSLASMLTSCVEDRTEEYVACSFAAGICPDTKAHADDGKGDHVNRCIMEIYYNGTLCDRQVSAVTDKSASFTATLALHRTYMFVFWADCGGPSLTDFHYATSPLTQVSIIQPYHGSDDSMDAFCCSVSCTVDDAEQIHNIELTRPFAQINVSKPDCPDSEVPVSFSAPGSYNVRDDVMGPVVQLSYTNDGLYCSSPRILSMDYIFATESQSTIDITADGTTYTDIPVKRNIRTNVTIE